MSDTLTPEVQSAIQHVVVPALLQNYYTKVIFALQKKSDTITPEQILAAYTALARGEAPAPDIQALTKDIICELLREVVRDNCDRESEDGLILPISRFLWQAIPSKVAQVRATREAAITEQYLDIGALRALMLNVAESQTRLRQAELGINAPQLTPEFREEMKRREEQLGLSGEDFDREQWYQDTLRSIQGRMSDRRKQAEPELEDLDNIFGAIQRIQSGEPIDNVLFTILVEKADSEEVYYEPEGGLFDDTTDSGVELSGMMANLPPDQRRWMTTLLDTGLILEHMVIANCLGFSVELGHELKRVEGKKDRPKNLLKLDQNRRRR